MTYPSISYRIADELKELTGQEIRVTIPGHYQRGGAPCPADRVLTSRFGVAAAQLILQKKFGYMVALQDNHIVPVPLTEVAGKLKPFRPMANWLSRQERSDCRWATDCRIEN